MKAGSEDLRERVVAEGLAQSEGIQLSVPTLWRTMRGLGFTRKERC